jgi:hypothetical protein
MSTTAVAAVHYETDEARRLVKTLVAYAYRTAVEAGADAPSHYAIARGWAVQLGVDPPDPFVDVTGPATAVQRGGNGFSGAVLRTIAAAYERSLDNR